jgi:DNA repair exonuclease SbcCD nuclease subunit
MIKKIVHISDLHIRNYQYHDMYKRQFKLFLKNVKNSLSDYTTDEIRVVITGDIFHQKINISNEQTMITSWFFGEITKKIGKIVIIPGNHDFLENNTNRLDSITPVVELMNNPNIMYYKDAGVYEDENINWVVYSLYQHNQKPEYNKESGKFYIGLFHGPIQGLSTDLGFEFENAYSPLNFIDLDLLLCGDIHKRQIFKLTNGGDAVMIGSMIQQNFGETVNHHGYGIYDVKTNKYETFDIESEQPFLHFSISDISDIEKNGEVLLNVR